MYRSVLFIDAVCFDFPVERALADAQFACSEFALVVVAL